MALEHTAPAADDPQHLTSHRINGVVDLPRPTRIAGWAIDRADPDSTVIVEICHAGTCIAAIEASQHRPDLERSGFGTGRYGFSLDLDVPIPAGMGFTVSARARTKDGIAGALRQIGRTEPSDDPATRLGQETLLAVKSLGDVTTGPAGGQAQEGPDTTRLAELCDRLETLGARLETMQPAQTVSGERPVPRWMIGAVVVALAVGLASLAIGIVSLMQT